MVPNFFMWIIWKKRNRSLFDDIENSSLDQLKSVLQRTLFNLSRCWGPSNCSSMFVFLASLRPTIWFLFVFIIMNSKVPFFFLINKIALLTYQEKATIWEFIMAREMSFNSSRARAHTHSKPDLKFHTCLITSPNYRILGIMNISV